MARHDAYQRMIARGFPGRGNSDCPRFYFRSSVRPIQSRLSSETVDDSPSPGEGGLGVDRHPPPLHRMILITEDSEEPSSRFFAVFIG